LIDDVCPVLRCGHPDPIALMDTLSRRATNPSCKNRLVDFYDRNKPTRRRGNKHFIHIQKHSVRQKSISTCRPSSVAISKTVRRVIPGKTPCPEVKSLPCLIAKILNPGPSVIYRLESLKIRALKQASLASNKPLVKSPQ